MIVLSEGNATFHVLPQSRLNPLGHVMITALLRPAPLVVRQVDKDRLNATARFARQRTRTQWDKATSMLVPGNLLAPHVHPQRMLAIDRDDSLQSSRAVYSSYLHSNGVDVKSAFTGIPYRANVDSVLP